MERPKVHFNEVYLGVYFMGQNLYKSVPSLKGVVDKLSLKARFSGAYVPYRKWVLLIDSLASSINPSCPTTAVKDCIGPPCLNLMNNSILNLRDMKLEEPNVII
jgi:hypothetical protein